MLDIRIGGKKIRPDQFANEMEKSMVNTLKEKVTAALRQVRCPVHGTVPSASVTGNTLASFNAKVTGCCEDAKAEAEKQVRRALQ